MRFFMSHRAMPQRRFDSEIAEICRHNGLFPAALDRAHAQAVGKLHTRGWA